MYRAAAAQTVTRQSITKASSQIARPTICIHPRGLRIIDWRGLYENFLPTTPNAVGAAISKNLRGIDQKRYHQTAADIYLEIGHLFLIRLSWLV
jgi:hypothetical protein